jgi:hypothetical protein
VQDALQRTRKSDQRVGPGEVPGASTTSGSTTTCPSSSRLTSESIAPPATLDDDPGGLLSSADEFTPLRGRRVGLASVRAGQTKALRMRLQAPPKAPKMRKRPLEDCGGEPGGTAGEVHSDARTPSSA